MRRIAAVFVVLAFSVARMLLASEDRSASAKKDVAAQGHILCLSSELPDSEEVDCGDGDFFALRTDEGELYRFPASDAKTAMFRDLRVREQLLHVRGRLMSPGVLEIIKIQSVREGRLYDLYYRCEVCHITAFDPGPCWCCQDDFEFRETLAAED